jgi:hypothetical protein
MTNKTQHFKLDDVHSISFLSTYHPKQNVWSAEIEPYEWTTESAMRMDMLIDFLADDEKEKIQFSMWDCPNEDALLERYQNYRNYINNNG